MIGKSLHLGYTHVSPIRNLTCQLTLASQVIISFLACSTQNTDQHIYLGLLKNMVWNDAKCRGKNGQRNEYNMQNQDAKKKS